MMAYEGSVTTSTCCACPSTGACATCTATPSRGSPITTGGRSTSLLRTWRSSCAAAAPSARPPRRSTSTRTLRQRLRRIGELSGLDLRKDDWLMVEIAVKMVRLQEAQDGRGAHTARAVVGSRHQRMH